jgi:hypothetical protein
MIKAILTISIVLVLSLSTLTQAATYGGGSGTVADPYQIQTPQHMNDIGANSGDWSKSFILMADIDMSVYTGTQYKIIGTFRGTFDGNNHVIRNLTYSSTAEVSNVGLFGIANGATIKNLGLKNVNFSVIAQFVGGLAGQLISSTVTNCSCSGTIADSCVKELYVGGLAGYQNNGTLTNCRSAGTVSAIMPSTSYSWNVYAGGLVGQQSIGTITNCFSSASVTATSVGNYAYAGGLVGYQPASICNISNSGCTGAVSAVNSYRSFAGGLIGYRISASNSLTNGCYSTGAVTASTTSWYAYAGGLIGYLSAPITDCYCTGNVTCTGKITHTGGLAGYATYATPTRCYSAGVLTVTATTEDYTGGSFGYRDNTAASKCFWDTTTSGLLNESGYVDYPGGITGKTTTEMKTETTFTDVYWDFDETWAICEGTNYPRLIWQIPVGDFVCPSGVNIEDLNYLAAQWLRNDCFSFNNYCDGADLNYSNTVDMADLSILAANWMRQ